MNIAIHDRQEVEFVFFLADKSVQFIQLAFLTFFGNGAPGSLAVYWLTQLATLCGLTRSMRAIEP